MADIINLTCPTCGGKLQITNDIDRFACGYCGNEHFVQRSGGIVTLAPVVQGLKEVRAGVDRTASELALKRLEEEIAALTRQRAGCKGNYLLTVAFGGVGIFCLFIWMVVGVELEAGFWGLLIFGIVLLAVAIWLAVRQNDLAQLKVASIDKAIAEKTKELERHKAIVQMK